MVDGGGNFLRYLKPHAGLAAATSEKGKFAAGQRAFDSDSVFGLLVDGITCDDDVLVCDDLGDEWADFIGLDARRLRRNASRFHAH